MFFARCLGNKKHRKVMPIKLLYRSWILTVKFVACYYWQEKCRKDVVCRKVLGCHTGSNWTVWKISKDCVYVDLPRCRNKFCCPHCIRFYRKGSSLQVGNCKIFWSTQVHYFLSTLKLFKYGQCSLSQSLDVNIFWKKCTFWKCNIYLACNRRKAII